MMQQAEEKDLQAAGQQEEEAAAEDLDFEITLGTRRDAASEAGSDDSSDAADSRSEEGFITGVRGVAGRL